MNLDILILVAFGVFVILLGWRIKERCEGNPRQCNVQEDRNESRLTIYRRVWSVVQLIVLIGLLFYMIPLLWHDFRMLENCDKVQLAMRCLMFVCTIYVLFVNIRRLLRRKKGHIG